MNDRREWDENRTGVISFWVSVSHSFLLSYFSAWVIFIHKLISFVSLSPCPSSSSIIDSGYVFFLFFADEKSPLFSSFFSFFLTNHRSHRREKRDASQVKRQQTLDMNSSIYEMDFKQINVSQRESTLMLFLPLTLFMWELSLSSFFLSCVPRVDNDSQAKTGILMWVTRLMHSLITNTSGLDAGNWQVSLGSLYQSHLWLTFWFQDWQENHLKGSFLVSLFIFIFFSLTSVAINGVIQWAMS